VRQATSRLLQDASISFRQGLHFDWRKTMSSISSGSSL